MSADRWRVWRITATGWDWGRPWRISPPAGSRFHGAFFETHAEAIACADRCARNPSGKKNAPADPGGGIRKEDNHE